MVINGIINTNSCSLKMDQRTKRPNGFLMQQLQQQTPLTMRRNYCTDSGSMFSPDNRSTIYKFDDTTRPISGPKLLMNGNLTTATKFSFIMPSDTYGNNDNYKTTNNQPSFAYTNFVKPVLDTIRGAFTHLIRFRPTSNSNQKVSVPTSCHNSIFSEKDRSEMVNLVNNEVDSLPEDLFNRKSIETELPVKDSPVRNDFVSISNDHIKVLPENKSTENRKKRRKRNRNRRNFSPDLSKLPTKKTPHHSNKNRKHRQNKSSANQKNNRKSSINIKNKTMVHESEQNYHQSSSNMYPSSTSDTMTDKIPRSPIKQQSCLDIWEFETCPSPLLQKRQQIPTNCDNDKRNCIFSRVTDCLQSPRKPLHQRQISECSDDFICFEYEPGNDDDGRWGNDYCIVDDFDSSSDDELSSSSSDDDDDKIIETLTVDPVTDTAPDSHFTRKKVQFNLNNTKVHVMRAWNYAYRAARKGPWEQIGRDRVRFHDRIIRMEQVLSPILATSHRQKIYLERFS